MALRLFVLVMVLGAGVVGGLVLAGEDALGEARTNLSDTTAEGEAGTAQASTPTAQAPPTTTEPGCSGGGLLSDPSSATIGGKFGSLRLSEHTITLHVKEFDFNRVDIDGPDGWSDGTVVYGDGDYNFRRASGFVAGDYTVTATAKPTSGESVVIQQKTVCLEPSG